MIEIMETKELTQKEKDKIDAFFEKYQYCEYFKNTCLKSLNKYEMFEVIDASDCYWEYRDDLLDEFDYDDLIEYLENNGYKVRDRYDDLDLSNGSIKNQKLLIDTVCKNITGRYLTKEDRKKEINDFIDFWF